MADTAEQNLKSCGANMEKFQYNKTTNHHAISNQQEQSTTSTFITSLNNNEDIDQEQVEAIKIPLSNISAQGGRDGE